MFINKYLKDDMTSGAISDWFEMGVFKRIFLAGRLFKFHHRVTSALKLVIFETWSTHANDVSKEVLIEILKYRDVNSNYVPVNSEKSCPYCKNCCFEYRYVNYKRYFCQKCKRTFSL